MMRTLLIGLLLAVSAAGAQAFVALDIRDLAAGEHRIALTASAGWRTASGATDIHIPR